MSLEDKYKQATEIIASGRVSDTLVDIIKLLVKEDQLDLIMHFKEKRSHSIDQLMAISGLSEAEILEKASALAKKGLIFNQPNSKGVMVFRLLPLANVGVYEYTFMKKLSYTEDEIKLAKLFSKLFAERPRMAPEKMQEIIQMMPAPDRTVPIRFNKATGKPTVIDINENVAEDTANKILLTSDVEALIEKFDEIAVGHCFCRNFRDTEDKHCKQTNLRENCFTFGKSARFTTDNSFMRMITKEEARDILNKSEEDGLVHKAYHPNFDISKEETSVCNCCKDCCGNSARSVVNVASFVSRVNPELCVGCGTCEIRCHPDAIKVGEDEKALVNEERCIGCGVCAYFCPQNAITIYPTEPHTVRVVVQNRD
ncbi:MAG: 4Fe-4S binding protein [Proteobacteria bacterium]|nr:4Fe-4S binding protein [Pseudomonadota bacterium]MBU4469011.1 4Fe-4S binding protein [Pseudomonadota bacterium]MCG2750950.1 4Fe-4S binding protein [Desulfobacteraceae bacterium]